MSRRAAFVLALMATASPLAAQQTADSAAILRALLARVTAQRGVQERAQRSEDERRAPERRGRIQTEGRLVFMVLATTPREPFARAAATADSILEYFGGIPDPFVRSVVAVTRDQVSDSVALLASPAVAGLARVTLEWREEWLNNFGVQSWFLIEPIATAWAATRDTAWRRWLPRNYGILWDATSDGEQAISDLAAVSGYQRGKECLAGRVRSCRLWLGVDNDANAFAVRYTEDELVREAGYRTRRTPDGEACKAGDGAACGRMLESLPWEATNHVPANDHARASLMRALRERHGADAMRRALADSAGSLGERMARAAGVSEDSLMMEWRMWVLSRGRSQRVSAGIGDFASALIFVLLLMAMATRSGRWR